MRAGGVPHRAREAERYQQAAEPALDQLQWCVNSLYGIRAHLAKGLTRNRQRIVTLRQIDDRSSPSAAYRLVSEYEHLAVEVEVDLLAALE